MMKKFVLVFFILTFLSLKGQDSLYHKQLERLTEKGYAHYGVHRDSGQYYFNKVKKIALNNGDTLAAIDMLITSTRHLGYFYDLQRIRKNLEQTDSLVKNNTFFWNRVKDGLLYKNSIRYDKGNYYFKLGDYSKAQDFFNKIRNSYPIKEPATLSADHSGLLSGAIGFLAKIHYQEGKFNLAKDYYLESIEMIMNSQPIDQAQLNISFALLAEVLEEQGQISEANSYLRNTLKQALLHNNNPNRIITVANHLANNHISLSQLDSTYYYLSIMNNYLNQSPSFRHLYHRAKAQFHKANTNLSKAILEIDTALAVYTARPNELSKKTLGRIYKEGAGLAVSNNNLKKALEYIDNGLEVNDRNTNVLSLELMALKTNVLTKMKNYTAANKTAMKAVQSLDHLKPAYQYSIDKINLIESTFPLFEAAIESNYALFRENGAPEFLENVHFFMEKSKSVLLMEALRSAKANQFAGVPDSLLEKERLVRAEITSLEKEFDMARQDDAAARTRIFKLKETQNALVTNIEKNYPNYFDLRYEQKTTDTKKILEILDQEQLLVSYFFGDNAVYGLSLEQEEMKLIKIPNNDTLQQELATYQQLISNRTSDIAEIQALGYRLYEKLLAPLVTPNTKRLLIIPDGNLNFLPFGTLSIDNNSTTYLIEKYAVNYINSGTLLEQLMETTHNGQEMLAFAPNFQNEQVDPSAARDRLGPLPHNKPEVASILASFDGLALEDENATLSNFFHKAGDYQMLHFATHSVFNDQLPEYSYLAFTTNNEENLLFVKDLYNLKLNANLVTLSACETGIGELRRGEGFLSLARAFFYSGAKSIASTLWKVNDASSSDIMGDFYQYLAKGSTKDQALRQAKLNFLRNNDQNALKHPYYWAGYIISGNPAPIPKSGYTWAWVLGGLLIVSGTVYWIRKKAA